MIVQIDNGKWNLGFWQDLLRWTGVGRHFEQERPASPRRNLDAHQAKMKARNRVRRKMRRATLQAQRRRA